MNHQFLYRGASKVFHETNEGLLKPKTQGPFTYKFHWDEPGFTWDSGVTWDSTPTNAVIRHQLNQEGFPTSGISTTPYLERAIFYVRGRSGVAGGYVFKIDRTALSQHGISEFEVSKYCAPSVPEDDEVILVLPALPHIPQGVIAEILSIPALAE